MVAKVLDEPGDDGPSADETGDNETSGDATPGQRNS
jgi:hypothetical protein